MVGIESCLRGDRSRALTQMEMITGWVLSDVGGAILRNGPRSRSGWDTQWLFVSRRQHKGIGV
jgi:hypothetical protein